MSITLDPTEIAPSVVNAVIDRLRSFTNVMALCPDESVTVRHRDNTTGTMPVRRVADHLEANVKGRAWTGHAIVVRVSSGGSPDYAFGNPTIDCLCYGVSRHEATRLAEVVKAALEPKGFARDYGFVEGDCAVTDIQQIAEIAPFFDRENQAFVRALSFEVVYGLSPVGAV